MHATEVLVFASGAACGAPVGIFFYIKFSARALRRRIERQIAARQNDPRPAQVQRK